MPLRGDLRTVEFGIPGRDLTRNTDIALNQISPDYFRALKVPLLKGRVFADTDSQNSEPVVILNQAAAARYFPGEDAVGRVVRLAGNRTVVGVVGDIRQDGPESGWRTQAFVPVCAEPRQRRDAGYSNSLTRRGNLSCGEAGHLGRVPRFVADAD